MFKKYFKVWLMMSKNSFMSSFHSKLAFTLFLLGKIIRFVLFTAFLFFLIRSTGDLANYSFEQVIFFFLTFNLVDILGQLFFREVYRFRPMIVKGDFDLVLAKPINPLFRSLMGGMDFIDLVTVPPLLFALYYFGAKLAPNFWQIALYFGLVLDGLVITTAFHIAILAFGIITFEIDHTVWFYRDLLNLGKLPTDIYRQPLKGILTFIFPVAIMITLPAKALMGLASPIGVLTSFGLGLMTIFLSLKFWNFALKRYTSASS